MTRAPLVAVIGGGISGLATAYFLRRRADVVVLEAAARPGGKVHTIEVGGVRVEAGADSFVVRKPWAAELCAELGLDDRVVIPDAFGALVRVRGRLVPFPERAAFGVPASALDLLRWKGLPVGARVVAVGDLFRRPRGPRRDDGDESLGSLLRRRLGAEASRVLVEPLLGGLHAGDASDLSVRATFPELAAWERGYRSLMRGARAALKAAEAPGRGHKPLFATVWGGLSRLVEALGEAVGPDRLRLDAPVSALSRRGDGYAIHVAGAEMCPDAVVIATPAFETARLLSEVNPSATAELRRIGYGSTAVVVLTYPAGTGPRLPGEGTGFVVPAGEGIVTACTWVSRKWPSQEMADRAVVRCFVGRAGSEDALALTDEDLTRRVGAEVESATPLGAEPDACRVIRWDRGMPQYAVGHLEILDEIDRALSRTPGIFVTGSAYRGVGIADCVRQARETADRVGEFLAGKPARGAHKEATTWTR